MGRYSKDLFLSRTTLGHRAFADRLAVLFGDNTCSCLVDCIQEKMNVRYMAVRTRNCSAKKVCCSADKDNWRNVFEIGFQSEVPTGTDVEDVIQKVD